MFYDENKIEILKNLPSKKERREAVLDYFLEEFDIKIPRNYSFEKAIITAEKMYQQRLEDAEDEHKKRTGEFVKTIVTPYDILRGDNSIIDYNDKDRSKKVKEYFKKGLDLSSSDDEKVVELPENVVHVDGEFISENNEDLAQVKEFVCNFDIILPPGFRPSYQLNLMTPCGKSALTIPFYVIDEIERLGPMWKLEATRSMWCKEIHTLIYYIQRDGQVIVRETRNSQFVILK